MSNFNSLEELKRKKQLLRGEIAEMEELLTFKNKKESLSVLTGGITDKYLKETEDENGEKSLAINTQNIMREISTGIKDKTSSKNLMGLANDSVSSGLLETTLKLGAVTFVGNYARKNINNTSWKKKIIGLALVYIAPLALKYIREKLEESQNSKKESSADNLI